MSDEQMDAIESLLARYEAAARRHGSATRSGSSAEANDAYVSIAAAYAELRRQGEQRRLLSLLTSDDVGVQLWAASHALEFAPEDGMRVLDSIERGEHRLLSLSARMTLREWRGGRLKFE